MAELVWLLAGAVFSQPCPDAEVALGGASSLQLVSCRPKSGKTCLQDCSSFFCLFFFFNSDVYGAFGGLESLCARLGAGVIPVEAPWDAFQLKYLGLGNHFWLDTKQENWGSGISAAFFGSR